MLPPVALASLTTVDVSVGVSVKVVVVVDVDVAGPSTERKSRRTPRQPHPGVVPRIGIRIIGIGSRSSSVNDLRVV
jgi:hypothetical protein